jgi:hypothetical protein
LLAKVAAAPDADRAWEPVDGPVKVGVRAVADAIGK